MIRKRFSQLRIGDKFYWLPFGERTRRDVEPDTKVGDDIYEIAENGVELNTRPSTEVWVEE